MKFQAKIKDTTHAVEVNRNEDRYEVSIDGQLYPVSLIFSDASHDVLLIDNTSYDVVLINTDNHYQVNVVNRYFDVEIIDPRRKALSSASLDDGGLRAIRTQMPGRIIKVMVSEGEEVKENQGLLILEAMKMQNEIKAPRSGVITKISVTENESVESNQILIELE